MNVLQFRHPDISRNPATTLSAQANSGDTTLSVVDGSDFVKNIILLLGSYGNDSAEFVTVASGTDPTPTQITLAVSAKETHSTDTPVIWVDYDQIEISKASTKGGSYSVVTTVAVACDQDLTIYRDQTGLSTDYYKIRYKNSLLTQYSAYSSEIPATGFAYNTFVAMVDLVYRQFSSQSQKILDIFWVKRWLNEGYRKMQRMIIDLDKGYFAKYGTDGAGATIALSAGVRAVPAPSDFVKVRRLRISYDGVNEYNMDPIDNADDDPMNVYIQSDPKYYLEGANIIPLPTPTTSQGYIRPLYYAFQADMVNDDDIPLIPLGFEDNIVNYGLQRAFESDSKFDQAKYYKDLFDGNNVDMLNWVAVQTPERPFFIAAFGASVEQDFYDGFQPPISG